MSIILQNIIAFYRIRVSVRVLYSGRNVGSRLAYFERNRGRATITCRQGGQK